MSNSISFTGYVGKDAEVKKTASGQSVLNVTVSNSVGFGDKQQTLWWRCALWGARAEKLCQYLKKGQLIYVVGEMTTREYQANDGTTKTTLELNATVVDLLGKRTEVEPPQANETKPSNAYKPGDSEYDQDIPF